jgi:hypothetical protein
MTRLLRAAIGVCVGLASGATIARAAAPAVDWVYPAGGQRGTSLTVSVGAKADGKIDPWPAKAWTDSPGIQFTPADANGQFSVHIAKDVPLGPHPLRIYNADGSCVPRTFIVGSHAELNEQEPNDDPRKPQVIAKLPAIINGRLDKNGDIDSFAVQAEAGKWIVAELTCHRLGSPVDPALHLLDPDGVEIAFNHDTFGLDPLVAARATRSGRYVLEVVGFDYPPSTQVRFAGSKAAVYRLLLTTGPYARCAFPPGLRRGDKGTLRLFGWNLGAADRERTVGFDTSIASAGAARVFLGPPEIDNLIPILLGDDAAAEPHPNDAGAVPLKLPATINSRIAHAGDVEHHVFTAQKGQALSFTVPSSVLDLPLDPVLTIEDSAGKQLARNDQADGAKRPFKWTAPADATYRLAIADRNHAGGELYVYRIEVRPEASDFAASIDAHELRLERGKSAELKVALKREGGYSGPLAVVLSGLPEGVTAATGGATTGAGPLTVTLAASPAAPAASGPVRVLVVAADEAHPVLRAASFDLDADSPMIGSIDHLWLTVQVPR